MIYKSGIGAIVLFILIALFISMMIHLRNQKYEQGEDWRRYRRLIHYNKDTTPEQRAIHRRAAQSEYWERRNIRRGLYA